MLKRPKAVAAAVLQGGATVDSPFERRYTIAASAAPRRSGRRTYVCV